MASIIVRTAALQYGTGKIDCHCAMTVATPFGDTEVIRVLVLIESEALGTPDWTDEDLCVAVATALGVDPSEVAVQEPLPDVQVTAPPQPDSPTGNGDIPDPQPVP